MVRAFGTVAAVAAAALAIIIGVIAFNAGSNDEQQARPPGGGGGQAGAPISHHAAIQAPGDAFPELVTGRQGEPVQVGSGEQPVKVPVQATSSGGGAFGGGAEASRPVRRASCEPGLLASLLATVGALLGGSGQAC